MTDHEYIWLEPEPPLDDDEVGRTWCQDNVYDPYDYDGNEPTLYIRNDIHKKHIAELEAQLEQIDLARKCLVYDKQKLIAKLDAVRPYLRHLSDCAITMNTSAIHALQEDCTCGLTALLGEDK